MYLPTPSFVSTNTVHMGKGTGKYLLYISDGLFLVRMETYSIESTCGHVRAEEYCISSKELIFLIVASDQVGAALSSQVSDLDR